MDRTKVRPFTLTSSGLINPTGITTAPTVVTIHSMVLTCTDGTTNLTLNLYVPTRVGDGTHNAVASTSDVKKVSIIVPHGTTMIVPEFADDGLFFSQGVYAELSGGSAICEFAVS